MVKTFPGQPNSDTYAMVGFMLALCFVSLPKTWVGKRTAQLRVLRRRYNEVLSNGGISMFVTIVLKPLNISV